MRAAVVWSLMAGATLVAGCNRESQSLPFAPQEGETVTRTVGVAGGVVSTSQGAAVVLPAGAVSGSTTVSLTSVAPPAAVQRSGEPVSTAFQLGPVGTRLAVAAGVELKFDVAAAGADAWLASVINLTEDGVQEIAATRVDLATGVVDAEVDRFGSLAAVVPEAAAVFPVGAAARRTEARASLAPGDGVTDSVTVGCGGPGDRCSGLVVDASQNLLDRVANAAAVYPLIEGALRISGTSASGSIRLTTSLRARLVSGQTAENVEIVARIAPTGATVVSETPTRLTLTQVTQQVSGSADTGSAGETFTGTLHIDRSGGGGTIAVTRGFELRNDADELEPASVTVEFPVQFHQ